MKENSYKAILITHYGNRSLIINLQKESLKYTL